MTRGSEDRLRTTHSAIFSLADHRVELRLPGPPPITNGDRVRVAGQFGNGVFNALVCRNFDTGWTSEEVKGLRFVQPYIEILISFLVFTFSALFGGTLLSPVLGERGFLILLPIALLIPCWSLVKTLARSRRISQARRMMLE
jgi:hypothetical protein